MPFLWTTMTRTINSPPGASLSLYLCMGFGLVSFDVARHSIGLRIQPLLLFLVCLRTLWNWDGRTTRHQQLDTKRSSQRYHNTFSHKSSCIDVQSHLQGTSHEPKFRSFHSICSMGQVTRCSPRHDGTTKSWLSPQETSNCRHEEYAANGSDGF